MKFENQTLQEIINLGHQVLPANGKLWLYGSRARGDNRVDSDWDLLIILDKQKEEFSDFDNYSYPFISLGVALGEIISAHIYTSKQWKEMSFTPFYKNVERDRTILV
ncbi:MAG: nucleotidyltransferase domain-containing protein [Paludibacteraceae bacterium]|nr:nucleotidyltransferase domain-containing protein [Paludibacteraceae bacterium]